jgi:shikimate kinase
MRAMNDLELYREQLAICDDKIIDALVERNAIVEKIMAYKEEYGMAILQPQQEDKQKRRLNEKLQENKYHEEIYDVFRCILKNSKRIQARHLFDYNIALIGFMGSGKTTVSEYISTMFAMKVVDMDGIIVEREEMEISDIFETYGEAYFRKVESELLKEVTGGKNSVISCGGGIVTRPENLKILNENSKIVLLTASPEVILERVKEDNSRPLLQGKKDVDSITKLMEARREKYETAADVVIHTDNKTILQICEEIVQKLQEL